MTNTPTAPATRTAEFEVLIHINATVRVEVPVAADDFTDPAHDDDYAEAATRAEDIARMFAVNAIRTRYNHDDITPELVAVEANALIG